MSADSFAWRPRRRMARAADRLRPAGLLARPELLGLIGLSAVLNLWNLSVNGWANTYYSAAVRSMSTSWHDFLFAALDRTGLMTVDKPPLSLWIQALSARVFGFHPLSMLVPQALMGIAAVVLTYDLTRRFFGRAAGFAAGVVLATTPVVVAVSRHNNPDELVLLCTVLALWAAARALQDGRTRWLVLSGVAVGLGFEAKMGVALFVVPGIALAWIWTRVLGVAERRERLRAFVQLLYGGVAMAVVGGAWPLLVTLTPAGDRPWISGTSDNSVWSLITGYNGLGRVSGQAGGPAAGGGPGAAFGRGFAPGGPGAPGGGGGPGSSLFGGATGPFRLLQSGLGDQGGWLLGFAAVAGVGLVVLTRLRRRDARTGWVIAVGGAFAITAVVFSFAGGIFHPYYVSLLAPSAAALIGAGVGEIVSGNRSLALAAIIGGAITEFVVLGHTGGRLAWARPLVVLAVVAALVALLIRLNPRVRTMVLSAALVSLLAAPAVWGAETLGHATGTTFPTGGPATNGGLPAGGPGGMRTGFGRGQLPPPGARGLPPAAGRGVAPAGGGGFPFPGGPPGGGPPRGGFGGGPGGGFGGDSTQLQAAIRYARAHGGGTIGVSSQSSAAAAILDQNADVAGLGGFSGRESSVSVSWLAAEVQAGRLRWVLAGSQAGARLPGDTRTGSSAALSAVSKACRRVTLSNAGTTGTLYDCQGAAAAIRAAG